MSLHTLPDVRDLFSLRVSFLDADVGGGEGEGFKIAVCRACEALGWGWGEACQTSDVCCACF